jgi:hypothetical protein
VVRYDESGWDLSILDTPIRAHFDADCRPVP